jgi:UDP-GlcNAc3NAcA epimerase
MSQSFFTELNMTVPKYNLKVGSGTHGQQTGAIMCGLEGVIESECPDWILVYGDTNSTVAAALVAAKKPCRLAHVEAGMRSYLRAHAEEVNRIVTDRLSDLLFCPTVSSKNNLIAEGLDNNAIITGDVMYDSFLYYGNAENYNSIIQSYGLSTGNYLLVTIHRAENVDDKERLNIILSALRSISREIEIILPLHPRTRKMIEKFQFSLEGIRVVEPFSYLALLAILTHAKAVVTDSGGLQKEAYFAKTPCLTIRNETEWTETLEDGWNQLVLVHDARDIEKILNNVLSIDYSKLQYPSHYGSGNAAKTIIDSIMNFS